MCGTRRPVVLGAPAQRTVAQAPAAADSRRAPRRARLLSCRRLRPCLIFQLPAGAAPPLPNLPCCFRPQLPQLPPHLIPDHAPAPRSPPAPWHPSTPCRGPSSPGCAAAGVKQPQAGMADAIPDMRRVRSGAACWRRALQWLHPQRTLQPSVSTLQRSSCSTRFFERKAIGNDAMAHGMQPTKHPTTQQCRTREIAQAAAACIIHTREELAAAQARVAELEAERHSLAELAVAAATDLSTATRLRAEAAAAEARATQAAAAAAADLLAAQRLRGEAAAAGTGDEAAA